jgi:hypothetical protein
VRRAQAATGVADGQKRQDGTRGRPPATPDGAPAAPHAGPSHRVPGELLILAGLILVMATAVRVASPDAAGRLLAAPGGAALPVADFVTHRGARA